jgi:hypothetical protein
VKGPSQDCAFVRTQSEISLNHYSLTLKISLLAFVKNLAELFLSSAETTEI